MTATNEKPHQKLSLINVHDYKHYPVIWEIMVEPYHIPRTLLSSEEAKAAEQAEVKLLLINGH